MHLLNEFETPKAILIKFFLLVLNCEEDRKQECLPALESRVALKVVCLTRATRLKAEVHLTSGR